MERLRPKNWAQFQHYKDRSPPWIKLHRGLLDSMDYGLLSPMAGKCLQLIWLIASDCDGILPDLNRLAFRLRVDQDTAQSVTQELVYSGFLEPVSAEQSATTTQRPKSNSSRHIPDPIKVLVFQRDKGRCVWCGTDQAIEYDHIQPVSKGGQPTLNNLQLLCRSCNRKKRVSTAEQAEQKQAEVLRLRSLETEVEAEDIQQSKIKSTVQPSAARSRFDDFWAVYPSKKGKEAARKTWQRRKLDPVADNLIAHVRLMLDRDDGWRRGFIPMGSTYLNQARWEDEPTGPPVDRQVNGHAATPSKTLTAIQKLQAMKNGQVDSERDHGRAEQAALPGT